MPRVPFAFEFESEWSNGNSVTKHLPNYHSAIVEKLVEWLNAVTPFDKLYTNLMNGNSEPFCRQISIRPFRLKRKLNLRHFKNTKMCMFYSTQLQWWSSLLSYVYWCFACTILDRGRGNRIICYWGKSCRKLHTCFIHFNKNPTYRRTIPLFLWIAHFKPYQVAMTIT